MSIPSLGFSSRVANMIIFLCHSYSDLNFLFFFSFLNLHLLFISAATFAWALVPSFFQADSECAFPIFLLFFLFSFNDEPGTASTFHRPVRILRDRLCYSEKFVSVFSLFYP